MAYGVSRGLTEEQCLAGSGLTPRVLSQLDRDDVDAEAELTVARNLVSILPDDPIHGVAVGQRFTMSSFGMFGFAMLTSSSVREAVEVGLRFMPLSNAFVSPSWVEDSRGGTLHLDPSAIPSDVREFMLHRDVVAISRFFEALGDVSVGGRLEIDVTTTRDRARPLRRALGRYRLKTGRAETVMRIPTAILELPMPEANAATAGMCIAQCEVLLARRARREGWSGRVRSRLLESLDSPPDADLVAAEWHIDRRTLHRRLSREGTTFRALVDEVRQTLAVELLGTGLGVAQVARRLGYAEPSGLTHAFIRWFGVPPSRYLEPPSEWQARGRPDRSG